MIPIKQELKFEYERIDDAFGKFVKDGWIIYQMISTADGGMYFLLHKY